MKVKDLTRKSKEGAGCIIVSLTTKKFLLIERSNVVPAPNCWSFPGGKVDDGETTEEAMIRELKEEINFDIKDRKTQLIYTNETHAPYFKFYVYAVCVEKEFKPIFNYEISSFVWTDLDNLPSPLHSGASQVFASDNAAKILNSFIESQSSIRF